MALVATLMLALGGCRLVFDLAPAIEPDAAVSVDAPLDAAPCLGNGHDEDGDQVDDACDSCPHVFQNALQQQDDTDGDGIGFACDPHPDVHDTQLAFFPFDKADPSIRLLSSDMIGSWDVKTDQLHLENARDTGLYLARYDIAETDVTVATRVTIHGPQVMLTQTAGAYIGIDTASTPPTSPAALVYDTINRLISGIETHTTRILDLPSNLGRTSANTAGVFVYEAPLELTFSCDARLTMPGMSCRGTIGFGNTERQTIEYVSNITRSGAVGLRTYSVNASFDYLVVYAHR